MAACVLVLSGLFEQNIYFMSSLFLGLTVCSLPFIIAAERPALQNFRSAPFAALGAALVVGLELLRKNMEDSSAAGKVEIIHEH